MSDYCNVCHPRPHDSRYHPRPGLEPLLGAVIVLGLIATLIVTYYTIHIC
jgi:hypothetical protein